MKFSSASAEIFVPDGAPEETALARTTHLAIGAHQDDVEIMACHGILTCFQRDDRWFSSVVVTDGGGSPRTGLYAGYSDEAMRRARRKEQRKAAIVGEYAAQVQLNHPSSTARDGANDAPVKDLAMVLRATRPETLYTHNPTDRHDTHVAVVLRTIDALRRLPPEERPRRVYGCEVWRGLDWLVDADKIAFDCSSREHLQAALLGVFDSQIAGGKRYDLATMGRRRANATYHTSHAADTTQAMSFGLDLTPLIEEPEQDVLSFVQAFIKRFEQDVSDRLIRLTRKT